MPARSTTSPRAALGAAGGLAWVASMALIAAVTPRWSGAARRFGLAMSAVSVGLLVGPPVAGLPGVAIAIVLVPATVLIGEQGARALPPTVGGAYALFNRAYAGGIALGPIVSGPAVEGAGFGPAMLLVAVAALAGGLASLVRMPSVRPPSSPG
ncbi:hypothetical protein [Pseudonocardia humida]|uniref:MFS transporter n=1 Tax=Pseudonocardia humida TaxID=2800819 RepID=A0ABT1A1Z8_9PSEU|nr:hypothetical protein [Pseudonocardia humida]MCO1657015.1 hypothetical protein [Pseudonocardia humida]